MCFNNKNILFNKHHTVKIAFSLYSFTYNYNHGKNELKRITTSGSGGFTI